MNRFNKLKWKNSPSITTPITEERLNYREDELDFLDSHIKGWEEADTLYNPFVLKNVQVKVQAHCHSTTSDGANNPVTVLQMYKNVGYGLIFLTDHNKYNIVSLDGILNIPASEYSPKVNGAWAGAGHNCVYNIAEDYPAELTGEKSFEKYNGLLAWAKYKKGLISIAHPTDFDHKTTYSDVIAYNNFDFMEIYNHWNYVYQSQGYPVDYDDFVNSLYEAGKEFWLLAVDDMHTNTEFNGGWIVVNVDSITKENVLEAMQNGNYYSSSGNDISISVSGGVVTATSSNASNFTFYTGFDVQTQASKSTVVSNTTSASYTIKGDEKFVRVKSTRVSDSKNAWSNPIFLKHKSQAKVQADHVNTIIGVDMIYSRLGVTAFATGTDNTSLLASTLKPSESFSDWFGNSDNSRFGIPTTSAMIKLDVLRFEGNNWMATVIDDKGIVYTRMNVNGTDHGWMSNSGFTKNEFTTSFAKDSDCENCYYKVGNEVKVFINLTASSAQFAGPSSYAIFTLPTEYRPVKEIYFPITQQDGSGVLTSTGRLGILPTGEVKVVTTAANLTGIRIGCSFPVV